MTTTPSFLVEPMRHTPLAMTTTADGASALIAPDGTSFPVVRGVPMFLASDAESLEFETMYQNLSEPWKYSGRAAEMLRHEFVVALAREVAEKPDWVLDLGCSVGQLSAQLGQHFPRIASLDVSATAVLKAKTTCEASSKAEFAFVVASATALPFATESFSLVVASDGLFGWELSETAQQQVLSEITRVLKPGGRAIFTDYLGHKKFPFLLKLIDSSPLQRERTEYLHDRLWYQMESWFHLAQDNALVKAILRNRSLALGLRGIARLFGARASKHIGIVARKRG